MAPKISLSLAQNRVQFWSTFWKNFGVAFDGILGAIWAARLAQGRLEEPKRAKEGPKKRKRHFSKKWFSHRTVSIFSFLRPPRRPQEAQKAAKKCLEGALKLTKKAPNADQKKN